MAPILLRNIFLLLGLTLAVITIVVVTRTLTLHHRTISAPPCLPLDTDFIRGDKQLLARFQQAIRIPTISTARHQYDTSALLEMQRFIEKSYATIHSSPLVKREIIANYSLLYTIQGSNSSLKPFMLMGHLDVVPVPDSDWEVPPFEGKIQDGFIYGRGTIDDKHTVFGILEALEFLLSRGHTPKRPFYLGFGHDEEVGGVDGANNIAQTLLARNVSVEYILDEGLTIVNNVVPGVNKPVALVGSSEKGRLSLRLRTTSPGGHSSMPDKESSIGILAKAISKLESNPHPSMFGTGPEKATFEHLAPEMNLAYRTVMSNMWLFSPLVSRVMSNKPSTNAITRTTTAVTMFHAGVKDNVIAPSAEAVVNHRIHPSQTVQEVIDYDRAIVNDERVKMTVIDSMEPLPKSPYGDQHFGWQTIKTSILQVWGHKGTVVAPGVMVGNTDTRHYTEVSPNMYRFSPTFMYPEDIPRFHGRNERISVENYQEAVNFFYHLLVNSDREGLEPIHTHRDEF